jgi:hypothetical protein
MWNNYFSHSIEKELIIYYLMECEIPLKSNENLTTEINYRRNKYL